MATGTNFTSTFGRTYYGDRSLSRNTAIQQTVLFKSDVAKISYRIHTGKKGCWQQASDYSLRIKRNSACLSVLTPLTQSMAFSVTHARSTQFHPSDKRVKERAGLLTVHRSTRDRSLERSRHMRSNWGSRCEESAFVESGLPLIAHHFG